MALIIKIKDLNNSFPPTEDEIIRRRLAAADALRKEMACHDRINSTRAAMEASSAALSNSIMGLSSVTSMSYALEAAQRAAAPNHLMDASSFSLSKSMSDFSRENSPYYAIAAAQRAAAPNYGMEAYSVARSYLDKYSGAQYWHNDDPIILDNYYVFFQEDKTCQFYQRLVSLLRFVCFLEQQASNLNLPDDAFDRYVMPCTRPTLLSALKKWESRVDKPKIRLWKIFAESSFNDFWKAKETGKICGILKDPNRYDKDFFLKFGIKII